MAAPKLQPLRCDTVRLLSCSQVITSIHSVVKELVENALDAKATSISIRLENYGLDVIEVKDNGSGVKKADVPSIALPHSTSKISSFHDLCTLETYGFRGEALYSLAAMASLSVMTCAEQGEIAHAYKFNCKGEIVSTSPVAMERGTTVMATHLFKDLPVRRQCYKNNKRCREELKKIEEYLLAFGISHPEVRLQLRHNKLTLWQKPVAPSFEANVETVLGVRVYQEMTPLNYQCFNPMVKLRAFVPKPGGNVSGLSRSTPERTFLLVNRRPVFIKTLIQVVKQEFLKAFPCCGSRYPVAIVSINVLPQALDVNLEPNKTSVLLHDLDFICTTLSSLLEQTYGPCKVAGESSTTTKLAAASRNKEAGEGVMEEGVENQMMEKATVVGVTLVSGGSPVMVNGSTASVELDSTADTVEGMGRVGDPEWEDTEGIRKEELEREELETAEGMGGEEWENTEGSSEENHLGSEGISCSHPMARTEITMSQWSRGTSCQGKIQPVQMCLPGPSPSHVCPVPGTSSSSLVPVPEEPSPSPLSSSHVQPVPSSSRVSSVPGTSSSSHARPVPEEPSPSPPSSSHIHPVTPPSSSHIGLVQMCLPGASTSRLPCSQSLKSKLIPKGPSPIFDMINSKPVKRKGPAAMPENSKRKAPVAMPENSKRKGPVAMPENSKRKAPVAMPEKQKHSIPPPICSREVRPCTADSHVTFDLTGVTRRDSLMATGDQVQEGTADRVIGWCGLKGQGVWLVLQDSSIACFNVARAKAKDDGGMLDGVKDSAGIPKTEVQTLLNKTLTDKNHQFLHHLHELS